MMLGVKPGLVACRAGAFLIFCSPKQPGTFLCHRNPFNYDIFGGLVLVIHPAMLRGYSSFLFRNYSWWYWRLNRMLGIESRSALACALPAVLSS